MTFMPKKNRQVTFRPNAENEKRLELAQNLGLNMSDILNEVMELKFEDVLKRKSLKIQQALAASN